MVENFVDLSNLIDPVIYLEDLADALTVEQLAKIYGRVIQGPQDTKQFIENLQYDSDVNWLDEAIKDFIIEQNDRN